MSEMRSGKIQDIDSLNGTLEALRSEGKRIVLCHGVFDLLHPGHIRHLESAHNQGDVLVVTLTADEYVNKGPGRPAFSQRLRAESLAALSTVDYVAINERATAQEPIRKLKPDVYVKGGEYADHGSERSPGVVEEERAVREIGGRMHYTNEVTYSSTTLLNSYRDLLPDETNDFLNDFRRRYTSDYIIELLKDVRDSRVLVVGDVMLDDYHFCRPYGMARKTPNIYVRFLYSEEYLGAALAVANHVAGICREVHVVSCLGESDSRYDFISTHLKPNISTKFFSRPDAPTTVKRRFVEQSHGYKMFEMSLVDDRPLPAHLEEQIQAYLSSIIRDYDLVIVADFGLGLIGQGLMDVLCEESRFLAVSAQASTANAGYNLISRYPRADYVCIDEEEARLACQDRFGPINPVIERIASKLDSLAFTVTRGRSGSTSYRRGDGFVDTPVFSTEVLDTIGAGDAFLALTAPGAAKGHPADLIGFIGNCAGALAVRVIGNRESVEPVPLFRFIDRLLG